VKRVWFILAFLVLAVAASPQTVKGPNSYFAGVPNGGCGPSQIALNASNGNQYNCPKGSWAGINTTGTAANLSGTPALPNGTMATTQATGDSTTEIATDAFVVAVAAGAHTVFTSNYNTPAVPSGGGNYMPLSGSMGSMLTTETNAKTIVASPLTVTSITAWVSAAETSTNTLTITLNDNGSATAATCTISASTNPCTLTGQSVAVNAQDLLDFQITQNGTGTSQRLTVSVSYY
jgi:hypothetical protein